MTIRLFIFRTIVLLLFTAALGGARAGDQLSLDQVQSLLENGQSQEAFQILKAGEDASLGDARYDRALAEAATNVGAYAEATLALERLLQLDAEATSARLELARIYSNMGNHEQAKYQLEKIANTTSDSTQLQQARGELKLVEEKISKRRKRPEFDPQVVKRPVPLKQNVVADQPVAQVALSAPVDLAPKMIQARQLLNDGQPAAAYELLTQLEFDGSGNVEFDYLLGVAALDAGKPDRATLALERVLSVDPNFAGARIDIGRAYAALGNTIQAKEEFAAVLKLNPPDATRQRVEKFVAEIENRSQLDKSHWTGFFAFTLGRDSNINGATDDKNQFIPLFNTSVVLDGNSVEMPSNYMGVAGKIQFNYQLKDNVSVYAGVESELQRNFQAAQFDRSAAVLRTGVVVTLAKHELELSSTLGKTFLEQRAYRDLVGVALQWRYNLNDQNQLQAVAQHNRLRYPEANARVFDTDQNVLGLNWITSFGEHNRGIGFIGSFYGTESDLNGNDSGAKRFYGLRGGGQYGLTANTSLFTTAGVTYSDFDREGAFLKTREDRRYDLVLGLNYQLWTSWSLRPQLSFTRQDSNIGLYDFDRTEIFVTLRRDWR